YRRRNTASTSDSLPQRTYARTILDVGTGNGWVLRQLAQDHKDALVIGIEPQTNAELIRNANAVPNALLVNGSAQGWDRSIWINRIDQAYLIFPHFVSELKSIVQLVYEVLQSQAQFTIVAGTPATYGFTNADNEARIALAQQELLEDLLAAGF